MKDAAVEPTTPVGVHVFDGALQTANTWVKEVMAALHTSEPREAYAALRVVLHTLRDRLPAAEAMQLGAQLPQLITGMFYDGYTLRDKPVKLDRDAFLDRIRDELSQQQPRVDPLRMVRAVIGVLEVHVDRGELQQVRQCLPEDLRALWNHSPMPH